MRAFPFLFDVVALLFPNSKLMGTLKLLDVHKVTTVTAAIHDFLAQTKDQTCSTANVTCFAENPKLCFARNPKLYSAENPKLCSVENTKLCSTENPKLCSDTSLKAARGLGFRSKNREEESLSD